MSGKRLVPRWDARIQGMRCRGCFGFSFSSQTYVREENEPQWHCRSLWIFGLLWYWPFLFCMEHFQWGWPVTRYILTVQRAYASFKYDQRILFVSPIFNPHLCGGRWQEHHPSHFVLVAEQSGSSKRLGLSLWSSCAVKNGSGWKGCRPLWPSESEVVSHEYLQSLTRSPDISECDLTFRRPSDQGKRAYLAKFCMNLEVQLLGVSEVNQTWPKQMNSAEPMSFHFGWVSYEKRWVAWYVICCRF